MMPSAQLPAEAKRAGYKESSFCHFFLLKLSNVFTCYYYLLLVKQRTAEAYGKVCQCVVSQVPNWWMCIICRPRSDSYVCLHVAVLCSSDS